MDLTPFAALPDDARLWLMALDAASTREALAPHVEGFLQRWRHKGTQYQAAWSLLEGRILAIAEPTLAAAPSGCAIDGMLRQMAQAAKALGMGLVDAQAVLVRQAGGLKALDRAELPDWLAEGRLDGGSPVLDLALLTLGELRAGRLERPLSQTWIGRKYKIQAPVDAGA